MPRNESDIGSKTSLYRFQYIWEYMSFICVTEGNHQLKQSECTLDKIIYGDDSDVEADRSEEESTGDEHVIKGYNFDFDPSRLK